MSSKDKSAVLAQYQILKEKGGFDIDDRQYRFSKMPFKVGKKVYAYMTTVGAQVEAGLLGFIDSEKFDSEIEPLLMQYTLCDGFKLDTLEDHFEEHCGDYTQFVIMSMMGYSAPFFLGSVTSSASTPQKNQTRTLKKQM